MSSQTALEAPTEGAQVSDNTGPGGSGEKQGGVGAGSGWGGAVDRQKKGSQGQWAVWRLRPIREGEESRLQAGPGTSKPCRAWGPPAPSAQHSSEKVGVQAWALTLRGPSPRWSHTRQHRRAQSWSCDPSPASPPQLLGEAETSWKLPPTGRRAALLCPHPVTPTKRGRVPS